MTGPLAILIGPMAAGKTSVGRALASRLEVPFADLDALIVEADGRSIPEIFAADGENTFRELEAATLARALLEHPGILSSAAALPCIPPRRSGCAAVRDLLDVDEAIAARRLAHGSGRPLLQGEDPMGRWRELARERTALRELAALRIDAGHGSPRVARAILGTLRSSRARARPGSACPPADAARPRSPRR